MKVSKMTWIVLGVGVFVIAMGALYVLYNQQNGQQKSLTTQINSAQTTLKKATTDRQASQTQLTQVQGDIAKLQSDLDKAKAQLSSSGGGMPKSVESIEYGERLFNMAQSLHLEVTSFASTEPANQQKESLTFGSNSFTINVKGATADVLALVTAIAKSADFASASVELVNIKATDPLVVQEFIDVMPKIIPQYIGTINISILSYKG